MKHFRKITLLALVCAILAGTCGCGETATRYKTTKKVVHVPETTVETKVVGQRIVGYETVYLPDGSSVDYDSVIDADDITDLPSTPTDTPSDNTSSDNTASTEPVKPMTDNFIEDGTFNYRIIRSADSSDAVITVTRLLNSGIQKNLNCKTNYKTDVVATNANVRELLVGTTNRAASIIAENKLKEQHALCYYDAAVISVGNDICIFGYERYALTKAMNWFLETYCNGSTVKAPTNIEKYFIDETKNPIATKIGDTAVSDFRIVIPQNASNIIKGAAGYLQRSLEQYSSAALNIVYDSSAASGHEIHIGATNRNIAAPSDSSTGNRKVSGGNLYYSSADDDLVYMMVRDFAESLAVASGSYTLSVDEVVSYDQLRNGFGNGYKLVWHDEFDGEALNWDNWRKVVSTGSAAATGAVTKYDTEKYTVLNNGIAHLIETRLKNKRYTNAALQTINKVKFLYGYMEIKTKITEGSSYASWWLNSDISSTARPEIDMYETFNSPKTLITNLHTWDDPAISGGHIDHSVDADNGDWTTNRRYNAPGNELLSDKWRIIGVEWTPDTIRVFADGEEYCTWDISEANTGTRYKAFRGVPVSMIFNASCANVASDMDIGESKELLIDYVRVWQRDAAQTGYESKVTNGQGQDIRLK